MNVAILILQARCFEDEDSADGSLRMVAVEAIDKDCEVVRGGGGSKRD